MAPAATDKYDKDNIFAKILRGEVPSTKIFENRHVIAILDAFPVTKGHVLVIPKATGFQSLMDMPPRVVCDVTSSLPTVAKAVKEATKCDGVNILSNCGAGAGQTVMHPHFHIVPRFEGDKKVEMAGSSGKIDEAEAEELEKAMKAALEASKPARISREKKPADGLQKPRWKDVTKISPGQSGLNIKVKCITEPAELEKRDMHEVTFADETGAITFMLRKEQTKSLAVGETYEIRNFSIAMVKGHMRGVVDKWGKIGKTEAELEDVKEDNNVSKVEYELVK